jgi:hypothetical protein
MTDEEKIADPKMKRASAPANLPWEDAIQRVLAEADGALHYADIAERIVSKGLRRSVGATPAATVAAHLSSSLREKSSPYLRVGRGEGGRVGNVRNNDASLIEPLAQTAH